MRLIEKRVTTIILLGINGMMLLLLYMAARTLPTEDAIDTNALVKNEGFSMSQVSRTLKGYDEYAVITKRPLFWSERQDLGVDAVQVQTALQTTVPLVLLGVVTEGAGKALLTKPDGKEITMASKGDIVEGWRIEEVGKEFVILVAGSQRRELRIGTQPEASR